MNYIIFHMILSICNFLSYGDSNFCNFLDSVGGDFCNFFWCFIVTSRCVLASSSEARASWMATVRDRIAKLSPV